MKEYYIANSNDNEVYYGVLQLVLGIALIVVAIICFIKIGLFTSLNHVGWFALLIVLIILYNIWY